MMNNNGNENAAKSRRMTHEENENLRLRKALQKAVGRDTAPESLRERIATMIRQSSK